MNSVFQYQAGEKYKPMRRAAYLVASELQMMMLRKSVVVASVLFPVLSILFAFIHVHDVTYQAERIFTDYQYVDLAASTGSAFLLYIVPFVSGLGWTRLVESGLEIHCFLPYSRWWHRPVVVALVNGMWASVLGTASYLAGYAIFFLVSDDSYSISLVDPFMIGIFSGRIVSYFFMAILGVALAVVVRSSVSLSLMFVFLLFLIPVVSGFFVSTLPFVSSIFQWFPVSITNQITEPWIYSASKITTVTFGYMRLCVWIGVCVFVTIRKVTSKDLLT